MSKKDLQYNQVFEDRLGYKIERIMNLFDRYSEARLPYERMWKLLDAFDSGDFWINVAKVMPSYSIKPDTNWINYAKEAYINSIYVGTYRGDVFCRELENEQTTTIINEFLEYIFKKARIKQLQQQAGERASLLNFGAIEIGWNADIIDGPKDNLFHGDLEVKFIDNLSLFLDPSVKDYKKGAAIFIAEELPLSELSGSKRFSERVKVFFENLKENEDYNSSMEQREYGKGYYGQRHHSANDNTVRLLTCYYKHYDPKKNDFRLDKIWILEDGFVLDIQKDLRPKQFPVQILYSSIPTKDPYGTPKTKLILNNAITLNLLDAIDSTLLFKALKRPKVISRKAGINEAQFAKHGDDPDSLWVVDGDPTNVVKYVDLPTLPADRNLLKQRLELGIMRVLNIDDAYNGTDTNSIQTTGGMDLLNQRLTMRDNSRIGLLENFILSITEYIMLLYLENSSNYSFPKYNKYNELEEIGQINFEDMRKDNLHFDFTCDVTPDLPNNVQRRSEVANIMMEKQMQYQFNPQLITPEEWLAYQDYPQKYKILQRIRNERMRDDMEDIESEIINYSGLVNRGVRPEKAIEMLASERQVKRDNSGLGSTGNANAFQQRQQG